MSKKKTAIQCRNCKKKFAPKSKYAKFCTRSCSATLQQTKIGAAERINLKKDILSSGMTQQELATKYGVNQSQISRLKYELISDPKWTYSKLSLKYMKEIKLMINDGYSQSHIAECFGVTQPGISKAMKEMGLVTQCPVTNSEIVQMQKLYSEGMSYNQISLKLDRHWVTVKKYIQQGMREKK